MRTHAPYSTSGEEHYSMVNKNKIEALLKNYIVTNIKVQEETLKNGQNKSGEREKMLHEKLQNVTLPCLWELC